jgi:hypothetical protein
VGWALVTAGDAQMVQNAGLNLGTGVPLMAAMVSQGTTLQAGVFEKGRGNAAPLDRALVRVALDVNAAKPSGPATVPLTAPRFQVLPPEGSALVDAPCDLGTLSIH